jgi:methyltransferase-like protein
MNFQSPQNESFALPNGLFINTADSRAKATLQCIYEAWPQSLSFEELYAAAAARVSSVSVKSPSAVEQEKESLSADILNIYSMGHFKLSTFKADFVTTVSDFPKVSKLALYQANKGIPVTNQLHEMLTPDVTGNALIKLCDGSNSRSQILEKFIQIVKSGELKLERQIPPEATDEQLHNELQPYVENVLQTLGKYALLVE